MGIQFQKEQETEFSMTPFRGAEPWTLLMCAASHGHVDAVKTLLEAGALVEAVLLSMGGLVVQYLPRQFMLLQRDVLQANAYRKFASAICLS